MLAGTWPQIVLKIAFVGSESSINWVVSCCSKFSRATSLDLTSADIVPSANVELAPPLHRQKHQWQRRINCLKSLVPERRKGVSRGQV
jgi:hypothetical protein